MTNRNTKWLFIPDSHIPYEHKLAYGTMLAAARGWKPDGIVIMGDFADMYTVSAHEKDAKRARLLEWELDSVNQRLDELDALGAKWRYYVEGNHEDRWTRYLRDKAPEFATMEGRGLHLREQLKIEERGWRWSQYKSTLKIGKLHVTHDLGKAGRNAARDAERDYQGSVVIGHTHMMEMGVIGNRKGKSHVAAMFGWLGDPSQTDYMHIDKAKREWVHGFGTGHMEPSGVVHITPHPIIDGRVCVDGKIYKGRA